MRAALLRAYGETVELGERPDPEPGPDETLVQVSAAPIVPLDLLCASGTSYFGRQPLPYVPGVQGVGVVVSSPDLPAGQRVWFATSAGMAPVDGSLAERCAVPACRPGPDHRGRVRRGRGGDRHVRHRRLDVAAPGAPGCRPANGWSCSAPAGRWARWRSRSPGIWRPASVVAVCRSDARPRRASGGRRDEVVVLRPDEDRADLAARLTEAAGGPVDVVIDPVFGEPAAAAAMALGPWGRLVNIGGAAHDVAEFSSAVLRGRTIDILGYTNNAISPEQRAEALTQVLALAARGEVAVEHRVIPLADCAQAWVLAGQSGPRIVLTAQS